MNTVCNTLCNTLCNTVCFLCWAWTRSGQSTPREHTTRGPLRPASPSAEASRLVHAVAAVGASTLLAADSQPRRWTDRACSSLGLWWMDAWCVLALMNSAANEHACTGFCEDVCFQFFQVYTWEFLIF